MKTIERLASVKSRLFGSAETDFEITPKKVTYSSEETADFAEVEATFGGSEKALERFNNYEDAHNGKGVVRNTCYDAIAEFEETARKQGLYKLVEVTRKDDEGNSIKVKVTDPKNHDALAKLAQQAQAKIEELEAAGLKVTFGFKPTKPNAADTKYAIGMLPKAFSSYDGLLAKAKEYGSTVPESLAAFKRLSKDEQLACLAAHGAAKRAHEADEF